MSLPNQSVGPPWDPAATRLTYPRLARLRWVFDLSAAQALVLAAIAERDFDYDTRQRPGVVSIVTAEVCEEVGITSRTLRAALERLHGAGLIEVVDRGQGRVGATVRPLYGAMMPVWARQIPNLSHLDKQETISALQAPKQEESSALRPSETGKAETISALQAPKPEESSALHIKDSSPDPDPVVVDDDAAFAEELDAARRTPAALPPRLPADRPDDRPDGAPVVAGRPDDRPDDRPDGVPVVARRPDDRPDDRPDARPEVVQRPRFDDAVEDRRPLPSDRTARQLLLAPSWLDMPRSNLPPEYDEIFEALVDCGTLALYRDALKLEIARAKDAAAKGERKSAKLFWSEAAQLAVAVRGKVERQRAKREAGPSREPGRPVGLDEALARDVERARERFRKLEQEHGGIEGVTAAIRAGKL